MTEIPNTPEHALQLAVTEVGLTLMDTDTVLQFLKRTNAPAFLIKTLVVMQAQLSTAGGALYATQAGLIAAIEQRDDALQNLTQAQQEIHALKQAPDASAEALAQLLHDLEIGNMNNPTVAALVNEVWVAAQNDMIARSRAQKGA